MVEEAPGRVVFLTGSLTRDPAKSVTQLTNLQGTYPYTYCRYVFLCGMQFEDEFAFGLTPTPGVIRTGGEPSFECIFINIQDKHFIEKVYKRIKISRSAAEKCSFL